MIKKLAITNPLIKSIFTRKSFFVLFLLFNVDLQAATKQNAPNIIFILADDLGYNDVGFNGVKWVETPNLNKLAETSKVFDNAYMYPLCSPSRAALITGKDSYRTQVYAVPVLETGTPQESIYSRGTVQKEHTFFSEPLNRAGYKLAHFGKWHVVGPYPEKEADYPFDKVGTQPVSGDREWIKKHLTPDIKLITQKIEAIIAMLVVVGGEILLEAMWKVINLKVEDMLLHL